METFTPKIRLASKYAAMERVEISPASYPCGLSSLIPSIHDSQHYQAILNNSNNFSKVTKCDVFEVNSDGGVWKKNLDEQLMDEYLEER